MPDRSVVRRFVDRVVSGAHAEAIEEYYAVNASMRENMNAPRVGRDHLVEHERRALARVRSVESTCIEPVFIEGDWVVIRWRFVFTLLDGRSMCIEELAHQRWQGDQIVEETFFYDPVQMNPQ